MRRIALLSALSLFAADALSSQTFRNGDAPAPTAIGFGSAAAFAGGHLFIGRSGLVPGFPMPPDQAGAVHVFERGRDGSWSETATITPVEGVVGDGFGMALAVRGNLLAVAAPAADGERGAVYVFERDTRGTWAQRARLTAGGAATGDRLGATLALGTNLLLAGSPGRDSARGAVIVFRRAGGTWAEQARLAGPGTVGGDRFGASLALAGDRALVGAPGPQGAPAQRRAGQAFTFRLSGGAWRDEARLTIEGDTTIRGFGSAVLLDNTGAFVSSPLADRGLGVVLQFTRDGREWRERARLTPADSARPAMFGAALARAGDELLVGAPAGTGAVHVLRLEGATWRATQTLTVEATGLASQLGSAIALEGGVALVGAPGADFFEGTGYLFARDPGGEWRTAGTLVDHTPSSLAAVTGGEARCDPSGRVRGFPCRDSDLASFMPVSALGGRRGIMVNDIWGWTDPETGREFALVGRMDGTAFVEVTDPTRPVYVGELPLHEGARPNLWRDIKVYRNHAFIVSDGAGPHGMQVFDLTQLRAVANPPITFRETAHYDRIHSAHNIAIDTAAGYAYPIGNSMGGETCGGGLHMIDIRNPTQPTFAGCWADTTTGIRRTGYTHDAQCVVYHGPDEQYRGRQICFSASETAVGIADVTDKQSPTRISSVTYPNVAYAHQGWLSDDHRYFFLDDEGDELSGTAPTTRTLVFDVADLDDPVMAKEFFGTTPASDHNLYVRGRYMYQSNYVAGLRVVDVGDPVNPVEVGYFDTVPFAPDRAGFAGTWSNYPFFKSGVVAVTSMREGLFMVRFRPTAPVP